MSDPVRVERHGPVTTVILNRPEARNAVNGPTATGLFEAFEEFDRDDTASVAVLWGDHGTFCAGADLKAFGTPHANAVHRTGPGPMGPTRMVLSKPVIAAVSGYAVAGGLELALWCDLRVAEQDAVFGVFCRRWGVPLIDGGTIRLPRLIGQSRAMDMILTGRAVDADRSAGDRPGQSCCAQRASACGRRGAGRRVGRAAAAVHAIGSAVGVASVGDTRNRGAGLRIRQHLPGSRRSDGRCRTFRRRCRPPRRGGSVVRQAEGTRRRQRLPGDQLADGWDAEHPKSDVAQRGEPARGDAFGSQGVDRELLTPRDVWRE